MKYIIYPIILLISSLKSIGQTNIQIITKSVGNHKIDKIQLFDLSQHEFYEVKYSGTVNFSFQKENIDCYNIRYIENNNMYRKQIWLDSGEVKIVTRIDSADLHIDSVYNSPIYYSFLSFAKELDRLHSINDTMSINKYLLDLYDKNIGNPLSLVFANEYLQFNQNSRAELLKLKSITNKQGNKFEWFLLYTSMMERLDIILKQTSINLKEYYFIIKRIKTSNYPKLTKNIEF